MCHLPRAALLVRNPVISSQPDYTCRMFIFLIMNITVSFQIAVTYMWLGSPLQELVEILRNNFGPDMLVWLDIVFNDQRSSDAVGKVCPVTVPSPAHPQLVNDTFADACADIQWGVADSLNHLTYF